MSSSPFLVDLNSTPFLFAFASNVAKLLQSQTMNILKAPTAIKLSITQLCSRVYSLKHRKWLAIAEQLSKFRGNANNRPREKTMKDALISQLESRFHQINLPVSLMSSSIWNFKFSQNAKVTCALTGRRLVRPVDFFYFYLSIYLTLAK